MYDFIGEIRFNKILLYICLKNNTSNLLSIFVEKVNRTTQLCCIVIKKKCKSQKKHKYYAFSQKRGNFTLCLLILP